MAKSKANTSNVPFAVPDWPGSRVEKRATSALQANPHNARTHPPAQIEFIRAAIKEFGWTMPVLVDEKDVILAGHARMEAAVLEGIREVPVIVARGWPEKKKRAYVEADNRLAELAGWDEDARKRELLFLSQQGIDLATIGWEPDALGEYLRGLEAPAEFKTLGDDIPTEHQCPSCGYRWSGRYAGVVAAEKVDGKPKGKAKARA